MRYFNQYNNASASFLILLLLSGFTIILFGETLKYDGALFFLIPILVLEILFLFFYVRNNIYSIKIDNEDFSIIYAFKKNVKAYKSNEIEKIIISITTANTPNVIFFFKNNFKTSFSCSDRNDLKKIYNFYSNLDIDVRVIPKERIDNIIN